MQSYSLGLEQYDSCNDYEFIKSLSEDEDDYDDDDRKEPQLRHEYECKDDPKKVEKVKEKEGEIEEGEKEKEKEKDLKEKGKEQEEEEPVLLLDKDKFIAKMLSEKGYFCLNKICFTDQGSVWRARSPQKLGSKSVVIKIASKLHYKTLKNEHEDILKEIELLQRIKHDSIICVLDTFENEEYYMVVLEDGGMDLFNFINKIHEEIKANKIQINEWKKSVKLIGQKLMELINWLHSTYICHLDLSLENVLISNIKWISYPDQYKNYKKRLSPDFELKLIDFGAAQCFKGNIEFDCKSIIGKPSYCSPQIYHLQNKQSNKPFDARKADVWSYGVCLFIMSFGCYPWTLPDRNDNKLYQTIVLEKNLNFVLKAWKRSNYADDAMKDLLLKIFVINEKKRISTQDILKHSWYKKF